MEKSINEILNTEIDIVDGSEDFVPGYTSYIEEVYRLKRKTINELKSKGVEVEKYEKSYLGDIPGNGNDKNTRG